MIIVLLVIFQLNFFYLNGMAIKNAADDCADLVCNLFKQPLKLSNECGATKAPYRRLSVNSRQDAILSVFLHKMAMEDCGVKYEIIFDTKDEINYLAYRPILKPGQDFLNLYEGKFPKFESLEQQYCATLDVVRDAWQESSSKLYDDLVVQHDETIWQLYVKSNFLVNQDHLINALAQRYLPEIMHVDSQLVFNIIYSIASSNYGKSTTTNIYLWIKKDYIDTVQSFFKFKLIAPFPLE